MKETLKREKIAPELLTMLDDLAADMPMEAFDRRHSQRGVIADQPAKPVRVIVMIDCDHDADFEHLLAFGIRINGKSGALRTGFLPLAQLGRLSLEDGVQRIHPSRTLHSAMNIAVESMGIPAFRTATGLSGRGVIIGIVDSGFDPSHHALHQRILRAWDQRDLSGRGEGVAEGGYGTELRGHEIEAKLQDERGHGTHVAAIAAGQAAAIFVGGRNDYPGVASGAEFILVRSDLNDAHIADGLRYIFRVAAELDRPAVINLSVSSAPGPFDGSDPLCRQIDELTGPGRIICCAAGNYGESHTHAQVTLSQGSQVEIAFDSSEKLDEICVQGVFRKQNRIAVDLGSADGARYTFVPEPRPGKQDLAPGITGEWSELAPGSELWKFNLRLSREPVQTSRSWRLWLRGEKTADGRVDLWLSGLRTDGGVTTNDDLRFHDYVDSSMTIGTPGAAARAITVASYTTRNEWMSRSGRRLTRRAALHDISPFSSAGPLVNGSQKPDIAAPGAWIISASAGKARLEKDIQIDGYHSIRDGTSMATGFISGLVALLLDRDPSLTPEGVKRLLRSVGRIPNQPPGTFHPRWGYGLPDVAKLV